MEFRRTARPAGSTSSSSRIKPRESTGRARLPAPRKSLGQHFLTDRNIIRKIVDGAGLESGDIVLEIGAGPGDLTAELASRAVRLFAVEIDRALCRRLQERFAGEQNVTIIQADALKLDVAALLGPSARYKLAGNLPYNAGAAIVRRFLEAEPAPERLVVMLQKEVAESMLARPDRMGLLAVGVQVYATGKKLFDVAPGSFFPPPKVRSSVIRLDRRPEPLVLEGERRRFFEVVRAGFSAPRKQLRNAIANGLRISANDAEKAITSSGLEPSARAQELAVEEWLRLTRALA